MNHKIFFLAGCVVSLLLSCTKKDFNPEVNLPRQFKPGEISITAGETEVKLLWAPSLFTGNNANYTVEISTDSTFAGPPVHTQVVDTSMIVITDSVLQVMQYYFARVKANQAGSTAESGWVYSSRFRITGEQIFFPINDVELKDTSVILKWRPTTGLTTIKLTPTGGATTTITLTAADLAANEKQLNGLTPQTTYTAEIFRGTISKGKITFTTKEKSIFSVVLNPGDDLVAAVNNAADGDVIGLEPGVYHTMNSTGSYVNLVVEQKTITLQAKSGDASNTIVHYKEINLKGTGAGITIRGLQFDGTAASADYFINFTGLNTDGEAATFTNVIIDNSIVKYTDNSLIRANRGGNNAHKIDTIQLKNSIFSDNGTGTFDYILLDKAEFKKIEILNSTFYNSGRRLISWATNITSPQRPVVDINYTTINSIGYGGRDNVLVDANANPIEFTLRNSILANAPKPGQTLGANLLRASSASSTVVISHSNLYNLTNGAATPVPLNIPSYVGQLNNLSVDPGWTATSTVFPLPPSPSPLRTASESSGPIGDQRWW